MGDNKTAITTGDLQTMYSSNDNPVALQNKIFFELSDHFGRRGKEGLHKLKRDSFVFVRDDID